MNQIILNLQDPSWWFTCLFYILIGYLVSKSAKVLPRVNKNMKKKRKLKSLRFIKNNRQHELKIQWLIGRYWSLAIVTISLLVSSSFIFALMPTSKKIVELVFPTTMFLGSYVFLFFLAREKELLTELIEENIKWRKKCSTN